MTQQKDTNDLLTDRGLRVKLIKRWQQVCITCFFITNVVIKWRYLGVIFVITLIADRNVLGFYCKFDRTVYGFPLMLRWSSYQSIKCQIKSLAFYIRTFVVRLSSSRSRIFNELLSKGLPITEVRETVYAHFRLPSTASNVSIYLVNLLCQSTVSIYCVNL